MVKLDLKKNLLLAIPVTAAVWLVSWIMAKLSLGSVSQLYASIPATSAITPTLGTKGLAILGGLVPINLHIPAIVILALSAFATLVVGQFIVEMLFGGKTIGNFLGIGADAGKVATYIVLGAAVGYAIFAGFNMPSRLTLIGVAIHTLAVAIIGVFLAKKLKLGI